MTRSHDRESGSSVPDGHVAASTDAVIAGIDGNRPQPVLLAFERFGSVEPGKPFMDDPAIRQIGGEAVGAAFTFSGDVPTVFIETDEEMFVLTDGCHFHYFENSPLEDIVDPDADVDTLADCGTVLGRKFGEPGEGYEPVGVNVALYIPESGQ